MEIVINVVHGGFGLSTDAIMRYAELKGIKLYAHKGSSRTCFYEDPSHSMESYWSDQDIQRDDPALVQVVKELWEAANGECAELKIVTIPDDVDWEIEEYDGREWVSEKHRTWG